MMLAGIPVLDRVIVDIIRGLRQAGFDSTGEALDLAFAAEQRVAALTILDREAILRVLEDCPSGAGRVAPRPVPRTRLADPRRALNVSPPRYQGIRSSHR
jgi:hypothetical protein